MRKKLIEIALPLDAINAASAREKSIRHGHPATLHLWWARRPLAAARAVIFAQMVDDPSEYVDVLLSDPATKRTAQRELKKRRAALAAAVDAQPTTGSGNVAAGQNAGTAANAEARVPSLSDVAAELERERLFGILEELVLWENTTNEEVLKRARVEIWQSWRRACAEHADHPRAAELFDRHTLPAFHDPFAGGGTLPLEAQRLGLEAHASDLNPVAVLINKAMIEIPPKFAGRPPVNPESRAEPTVVAKTWRGAQGLAEDVRHYGQWMREEAEKRIGHLYPPVEITPVIVRGRPDLKPYEGRKLTVIAWLWARTVKSPNPAFADVDVPLASTFMLSTKKGKEAYVEPVIEGRGYRFTVKVGAPSDATTVLYGTKSGGSGSPFLCLMSGSPMPFDYLRAEGKAGRLSSRLLAVVTEGDRERIYLSPIEAQEFEATQATPLWTPDTDLPKKALGFRVQEYGMISWRDLFTPRQLVALTTFSDLVGEATERIRHDASGAGLSDNDRPLLDGGTGATAYAEAVAVYLAFCVDKNTLTNTTQATWQKDPDRLTQAFSRQAIPMVWDYAEANPLSAAGGGFSITSHAVGKVLERLPCSDLVGAGLQHDATTCLLSADRIVSSDPPYYDNIGYADLSDFFYVWLRCSLKSVFPELFATLTVPKAEELVATPYRHGGKGEAETFFHAGMTQALHRLAEQAHPGFPVTIYYAFKQSETKRNAETARTGWETFLDAVIRSGFAITGTWPIRTELVGNLKKKVSALASSVVLVCRRRPADTLAATRREFLTALRSQLPHALRLLQTGNVAPVDLAQAAIGPGMAIFTHYAKVLNAAGTPMSVREALALINEILDEVLAEQEGDFDADSRWALAWFEQYGFAEGDYGVAETLSKAKNTSVAGMVAAGILKSQGGTVRLLTPKEAALGATAETARELCYRLYTLCERKKRAAEALSYNSLVQSWSEITRLARAAPAEQAVLFDGAQ